MLNVEPPLAACSPHLKRMYATREKRDIAIYSHSMNEDKEEKLDVGGCCLLQVREEGEVALEEEHTLLQASAAAGRNSSH